MDKYERLKLMKMKIEALKEHRKKIERENVEIGEKPLSFVSYMVPQDQQITSLERKKSEKANVSVQTEHQVLDSINLRKQNVITYEQATQTETISEPFPVVEDRRIIEQLPRKEVDSTHTSEHTPEKPPSVKDFFDRQPTIIKDQGLSLNFQTFSLQESLLSSIEPSSKFSAECGALQLSHTFLPKLNMESCQNFKYIWADVSEDLLCTILYFESQYIENSMVQIYHVPTTTIVDSVIFSGQTLVRAKFVENSSSKVTSLLLTAYTGKSILYELRSVQLSKGRFEIERNVSSTNYMYYPVYAIHLEKLSNSVFLANTSGQITELSTLDLKPTKVSPNIRIVPQSRSDLLTQTVSVASEKLYYQHLLTISLYDELSILCMLVLPSDLTSMYFGSEDGFIYKISPFPLKYDEKGLVKIDIRNHGFIPERKASFNDLGLFHLGPVTGMQICPEAHGVFCSYSLDGMCHFWDTVNNRKIETIECDSEIIFGKYLTFGEKRYLGLLTPKALQFFRIRFLHSSHDLWQIEGPILSEFSIYCEDTPLKRFSSFQTLSTDSVLHIVLGGESSDFGGLFIYNIYN